ALLGVLLTFNITLRELLIGLRDSLARFWVTIWSATPTDDWEDSRGGRDRKGEATSPLLANPAREAHTYEPPPGAALDDIVPTPIAARLTRASLFNRPEFFFTAATPTEKKAEPTK